MKYYRCISGKGIGILCHEQVGTGLTVSYRACNTVFYDLTDHDVRCIYDSFAKKE